MRYSLLALLAITAVHVGAADPSVSTVTTPEPIAQWAFGAGSINGAEATAGQNILPGQDIVAGTEQPVRLSLAQAPDSAVIVGPGSHIRFRVVAERDIVTEVDAGVIQVDLPNRGPWRELIVSGGAMEVHVVGTLFMFERVKRDQDYLAMVHGKVKVNLLAAIAQALGQDSSIDLDGQRGLEASGLGFGDINNLNSRPQIATTASAHSNIKNQGQAAGGGWDKNAGAEQTTGGDSNSSTNGIDLVTGALNDSLNDAVVESIVQDTVQEVIEHTTSQSLDLPGAPDPPN